MIQHVARMKSFSFGIGFLTLLILSGCGKDQRNQDEVVRELEESFALDTNAGSASEPSAATYSQPGNAAPPQTTQPTGHLAGQEISQTSARPLSDLNATDSGPGVPPAVQLAAQEVVRFIDTGQYAAAVEHLDQLMGTPDLTPDQWIATRNAMAEVQRRIIMDPAVSEEEKQKARAMLNRQ